MDNNEFFKKLEDKKVRFVTIEIIQNGFIVTLPEYSGKDEARFHRLSLKGVNNFLKKLWGKDIKEYKQSKLTKSTVNNIVEKPKKKKVKKK